MSDKLKKPRVFIAEPNPRFDLAGAAKCGEVTYLSPVSINPLDVQKTFDWLDERLTAANFDPDVDLIALSGSVLMVTFAICAASLRYETLNLLVFDARSGNYISRKLTRPSRNQNHATSHR